MAHGLKFEWDESKRRENIDKHNIDFNDAKRIFDHPRLEDFDHSHSEDEDRYWALGLLDGRVIKVIYTFRQGTVRLVSAFSADESEAVEYFSHFLSGVMAGDSGHGKPKGRKSRSAADKRLGRRRDRRPR